MGKSPPLFALASKFVENFINAFVKAGKASSRYTTLRYRQFRFALLTNLSNHNNTRIDPSDYSELPMACN